MQTDAAGDWGVRGLGSTVYRKISFGAARLSDRHRGLFTVPYHPLVQLGAAGEGPAR